MIKKIFAATCCILLIACQKPTELKPAQAEPSEAWVEAQYTVVEQLKEKSFGEAESTLQTMMTLAEEDLSRWEYIRMGLVSMPPDLALPMVETALRLPFIKKSGPQLFGFSKVYTQFKDLENALITINQAIDIKKEEDYVFWRARLHLMLKKHQLAEKDYQWLLKKDDSKEAYVSQYASLLNHLNRADEAQALLEAHANNPDLLYKSIILAIRQDNEDDAQEQFVKLKGILAATEIDDQKRLEIGELAYWLNDTDYSMDLLSEVKSGDKISQAKLIMGNVQLSLENHDRAIALYRQAQNGTKEQAALAYLFEAQAHRELGETRAGIRTLDQAVQLFPDESDLRYSRAMMYETNKQINKMETDLLHIIKNDPEHYDALNALGYSWADRNIKLEQALAYIEKAHEMRPDNVPILDSLAWVHFRLGNLDQARSYMEQATKEPQQDQLLYDHLLEILEAIGDEQAAATVKDHIQQNFTPEEGQE